MKPLNVVLALSDSQLSAKLTASLAEYFKTVAVVHSIDDLRGSVLKHRAEVAVVDLELAELNDVEALRQDLPGVDIICTHRLADELLWTRALSAGALDCCHPDDVRSIVFAAHHTQPIAHSHAA